MDKGRRPEWLMLLSKLALVKSDYSQKYLENALTYCFGWSDMTNSIMLSLCSVQLLNI